MPNKLQKKSPPRYSSAPPLDNGIRYESLPLSPDSQQPRFISPVSHQAVLSGGLARDPPNSQPTQPAQSIYSPVSPLMDIPQPHAATALPTVLHAPQPQRQSVVARKSVDLRRLDGTPYASEQQSSVKVARDLHEGALPPAYNRAEASAAGNMGHAGEENTSPHQCSGPDCRKCGKRKMSHGARASAANSHTASGELPPAVRPVPTTTTLAGPSSQPLRHCHKCGKPKKPTTAPLPQSNFSRPMSDLSPPPTAPLPGQPPLNRTAQAGLSLQMPNNLPPPMHPQIDIIPPSASTYRPGRNSGLSNNDDDAPLVRKHEPSQYQAFRPSSLIRSLSRKRSKGKQTRNSYEENQRPQGNNEEGLMRSLSNRVIEHGGNRNYQQLRVQQQASRPTSPFSYMEAANEEAFEMKPLHDSNKEIGGNDSMDSPSSSSSSVRRSKDDDYRTVAPGYAPVIIEDGPENDIPRRSNSFEAGKQDTAMLGVASDVEAQPNGSRPPITRFASLRGGLSRAASTVSRNASLRRFESLKKVHENWYRDDMAIEGHNEGGIAVF